jgi:hypothetical protein
MICWMALSARWQPQSHRGRPLPVEPHILEAPVIEDAVDLICSCRPQPRRRARHLPEHTDVEHHSDPDVSIEACGSTSYSRNSIKRFAASSEWEA